MPAFWARPADVGQEELVLRGEEAHHLARVRRHRPGDLVEVIDGEGMLFRARVQAMEQDRVACRIVERLPEGGESRVRLCLAPALLKGTRFDWVVEKATEVGVDALWPLLSERTVVRPGDRVERWQRLALEAAKQCGRARWPRIRAPLGLEQALEGMRAVCDLVLMAVAEEAPALGKCLEGKRPTRPGLFIGPEGGFSAAEQERARRAGVEFFTWGPRTLRADTAAVVLAALVLHEAENMARGLNQGE
jgi:16S rRNA (uracil1498-N3)-methyltransferase